MIHPYLLKRRILLSAFILVLGLLFIFRNTSFLIRAISTIFLLLVFYIFDHTFGVNFRLKHYFYIIVIAVTGFLLSPLYYLYPNYDKLLHFIQPILFFSMVYHMVSKLKLKQKWKILFSFFIIVGCIGIFEIGEYSLDYFFDLKYQGVFLRDISGIDKYDLYVDRIDDTMVDMVMGIAGAIYYVIAITLSYLGKKSKTKAKLKVTERRTR